jgi:hypothetical protein
MMMRRMGFLLPYVYLHPRADGGCVLLTGSAIHVHVGASVALHARMSSTGPGQQYGLLASQSAPVWQNSESGPQLEPAGAQDAVHGKSPPQHEPPGPQSSGPSHARV